MGIESPVGSCVFVNVSIELSPSIALVIDSMVVVRERSEVADDSDMLRTSIETFFTGRRTSFGGEVFAHV
jgi:hypothetical protein